MAIILTVGHRQGVHICRASLYQKHMGILIPSQHRTLFFQTLFHLDWEISHKHLNLLLGKNKSEHVL